MSKTKFIFVTGGVSSSLGKGIISSSLAKLLQSRGFSVTIQKFDPYINIDPGTLNPSDIIKSFSEIIFGFTGHLKLKEGSSYLMPLSDSGLYDFEQ